jgi:hypothetical protein
MAWIYIPIDSCFLHQFYFIDLCPGTHADTHDHLTLSILYKSIVILLLCTQPKQWLSQHENGWVAGTKWVRTILLDGWSITEELQLQHIAAGHTLTRHWRATFGAPGAWPTKQCHAGTLRWQYHLKTKSLHGIYVEGLFLLKTILLSAIDAFAWGIPSRWFLFDASGVCYGVDAYRFIDRHRLVGRPRCASVVSVLPVLGRF